ncbi:MAG: toprim domain-containing protein [Leptospirillum sp.]
MAIKEPARDLSRLIDRLWNEAPHIQKNDPADIYLRKTRCIDWPGKWPETLRFHQKMLHRSDVDTWHPAVVATILSLSGRMVGLLTTFLTPDGQKASVDPVKRILKSRDADTITGSAIRLGLPTNEGRLGISEGIESGLSAAILERMPVWCGLSAHGMETIELPEDATRITIFSDRDPAGLRAAANAVLRFRAEGRQAEILTPDETGWDFNDVLKEKAQPAAN